MIVFAPYDAQHFLWNGTQIEKGAVELVFQPNQNVSFYWNGAQVYGDLPLSAFQYDDGSENDFSSLQDLRRYYEDVVKLPTERIGQPFRHVATASINAVVLRSGSTVIESLVAVNDSQAACYLKVYDQTTAPDPAEDVPVLTFQISGRELVSDGYYKPAQPVSLLGGQIRLNQGFAIAITGAVADTDETEIDADIIITGSMR